MIKNKYGYLSSDHREFIITDPLTPRPWFNYMWNDNYGGLISHTGGGFSFLDTPRDNRLTRMRYNSLPWDRPGRYIMLRDNETANFWSLSWQPTPEAKYDYYECRHGLGYTTIITEVDGIRAELTYFVPRAENAEIWKVSLINKTSKKRSLSAFAFTELMMGNALNDIINQPNDKHFTDIHFNKKMKTLEATRRYWVLNKKVSVEQPNMDWKYWLLFTSTLPVSGFDGSLDAFIGKWRSESNPIAVEKGKCFNSEITAGEPVAALQSKITLQPGKSKNFAFIMAVAPKEEEQPYNHFSWKELITIKGIEKRLAEVKQYWDNYLSNMNCTTPDERVNAMINVWNQYQAAVTFDMARNSGYYHGGLLFGNGIRDQFQDILGMVFAEPDRVRNRILNALKYQFADGSTLHNFFKITEWGEKTNHSDTPLWIPYGIIEYLNETGDFSILNEQVAFYDNGKADVYTHLYRAVEFAMKATTERGLPKIMNGDWNDTLDKVGPLGKGETIWGACFLAYILKKSFDLLSFKKDTRRLNLWKKEYHRLAETINDIAWDGNWYIRAFSDSGKPLGSSDSGQGKIFLNAQSWAVISGIAPPDRAAAALKSAEELLERQNGMQIVYPSYTKVEDGTGLISRCVPGKKENGAIFNHASAWFALACFHHGNIEKACDIYRRMLPFNSSKRIDRYECEPYVFAEYVTSPDHPTEGQASHSWLTGSAVWMLRNGTDLLLGFKTSLQGITIDPNIPAAWKKVTAVRKFRGKTIHLTILNPKKKNKGFDKISVNCEQKQSNFINVNDYREHDLHIEILL